MGLSSVASVRRLANMWVDLSPKRQDELLSELDAPLRESVVERMREIKNERKRSSKDDA
tara:strand:- start:1046 stop:1222 length:177 start_codon:yes stop_codon:yes gene_type:complete